MATQAEVSEAVAALNAEMNPEPVKEPEKAPEPVKEEPKEPPKEEPKAEEPAKEPPKPKPTEKPSRKAEYIPAAKFHETRHELQAAKERAKELEAQLEAAKAAPVAAQPDDEIVKVATKYGLDKEVVSDIVRLSKSDGSTKELQERLARIEAEKLKSEDEAKYRNEEGETLSRFPELKPYAKDLKEMAYAEGNERVPLEYLALKLRHDLNLTESVAPAESPSSPPAGKLRDMTNLSEEDINGLSGAELDRFIAANRLKR